MSGGRQEGGAGRIDFPALAADLLGRARVLVPEWAPGGKCAPGSAEWTARNPTRPGDKKPGSFRVNLDTGAWSEFATGDAGRDLISLYAYLHGARQADAARELAQRYGLAGVVAGSGEGAARPGSGAPPASAPASVPAPAGRSAGRDEWTAVQPVPADAPPPPGAHYRLGTHSREWVYRDAQGRELGRVRRFDLPDGGKDVVPLTFCVRLRDGRKDWRWKAMPAPRPLYRLPELAARPDALVVWCEGEKAADAAAQLLPDCVTTTHAGGAKAWRRADYQPLAGRRVLIWPDADEPGRDVAQHLTELLRAMGCTVHWAGVPADRTDGWDAADALAEGWTPPADAAAWVLDPPAGATPGKGSRAVHLPAQAFASEAARTGAPWPAKVALDERTGQPWPPIGGPWLVSAIGLCDGDGEMLAPRPMWVTALTESLNGDDGIVLQFFDRRWRLRTLAMPVGLLHKQAGIMGEFLHLAGCMTMPGKEKWVARYLLDQEQRCTRFIKSTSRLGWYSTPGGAAFVCADEVIGHADDEVVYQSDIPMSYAESLGTAGTLMDWQREVAAAAARNPLLLFALCAALAGALLKPLGEPSGGFHFYGRTTGGKTTMGQVAASVWGCGTDPSEDAARSSVRKWDVTATSLETLAELHSHQVLVLDDAGQTELEDVGVIAYKLASGRGKERGLPGGGLRPARTWQTMILSNGEVSLARLAEQRTGRRLVGGQLLRMVDIPVDRDDGGRGVVVDAAGGDPKAFVERLKRACEQYYGTPGRAFVRYLLALAGDGGLVALGGTLRAQLDGAEAHLAREVGDELPVEARRVLRRFALVLLAGVHAARKGADGRGADVLPFTAREVLAAVVQVLRAWLSDQGAARSDVVLGLAHLREQMLRHAGRVQKLEVETPPPNRLGWRADEYWMLLPSALPELCDVFDPQLLVRELDRQGLLWHEDGRLTKKAPRLVDMTRRPNLYWISTRFLGELGDDE